MSLVLVTGATGEVARGVLPYLEKDFDLRLLALDPPVDDPRRVQVDLLDREGLARAMNGVDAVLHLAVAAGHTGRYEDDAFNDRRFDVNVKGTYHVFEEAERARVRRVVYVSSLMVSWGQAMTVSRRGGKTLVPGDAPPAPVGTYALTKALGEEIARYYGVARKLEKVVKPGSRESAGPYHGLEVITVRIAGPLDLADPDLRRKPVRPQQVPVPDLAQAFCKALTVPLARYAVVTVVGVSSHQLWDLDQARRVLGYEPEYRLDDLGVRFADPFAVEPV
jgi:nucleoside-diphosphate-sugar epimerase